MAVNAKAIKRRIRSVGNTKKITKAMEMISAVKMRKAVDSALNTRMYARLAQELLDHLAHIDEPNFPLFEMRPVKKLLAVVISSNKGLCGSFNSNIFKKTRNLLNDTKNIAKHRLKGGEDIMPEDSVQIDIIGIGKRTVGFAKRNNYNLISLYDKLDEKPGIDDIMPIAKTIIDSYKSKKYDKVVVAFTDFKSSLFQEPKLRQILPLSQVDLEKMLADIGGLKKKDEEIIEKQKEEIVEIENYLFEPGLEEIIETVVPRLVQVLLYQALLESTASEHSARMLAMKNASSAANDMIKDLNLYYNKARQAGITQEIAEIAGGAAALE
ncbi:TPA: ATP synthase F1 subunit gamma [Candidatus Magasanikbacteria bacterium]|nr:ATP synthase F1 subunit gamma [Candidatus Magasanikbacteria bacterium]